MRALAVTLYVIALAGFTTLMGLTVSQPRPIPLTWFFVGLTGLTISATMLGLYLTEPNPQPHDPHAATRASLASYRYEPPLRAPKWPGDAPSRAEVAGRGTPMSDLGRPPLCGKIGCPLKARWEIVTAHDVRYRCDKHARGLPGLRLDLEARR